MRCGVLVVLMASACGRIDFAPLTDTATPDAGSCNLSAPFGDPVFVDGVMSGAGDITMRLQSNELDGVFWSLRTGDADLFEAHRPDRASPFTVLILTPLNSASNVETDPTVAPDGSFAVFASNRPGGTGSLDLYESLHDVTGYQAPVELAAIDSGGTDGQANWSPSESALYFSSDRSGTSHLFRSVRTGPATYTPPVLVSELTGDGEEYDPVPSADGLVLYFRSSRAGGPGGTDMYVTRRARLTDPFGPATLISELSSTAIDGPSFLSPDQCRIYFTSDRTGTPNIYVASHPK